eukprot:scaffold260435_cov32-Tisochrysis_lutea.AAC.4
MQKVNPAGMAKALMQTYVTRNVYITYHQLASWYALAHAQIAGMRSLSRRCHRANPSHAPSFTWGAAESRPARRARSVRRPANASRLR